MVRYRRKRTYRRYTVRRRRPTRRTYQKTPKQLHYALAPQPQIVGSAANIYSAGTLYQFYWVGQGAGIDARLGNKILPVSVLFRGVLTQAGTQQQVVRVLISRSRAGVLTSTDFPSANPWDMPDYDKMQVLYDKWFYFVTPAATGYTPIQKQLRFYKKFRTPKQIEFNDSAVQPIDGQVYMWVISNASGFGGYITIQGQGMQTWYNAE